MFILCKTSDKEEVIHSLSTAAVRTEALVYGDLSHHIKVLQNSIYCLN